MDQDRIRAAAERVAGSLGLEIVEVEWKVGQQRFLRVTIDKPEGVSHADCQALSEQLSVLLDVEDLVPGPRYVLEVSSPGMDRKLLKAADYERFVGRLAKIWTKEPVTPTEGARPSNYFEGRLAGITDGQVRVEITTKAGVNVFELPYENIRKANLIIEF
ncbi:MAG TPA: ribosome maturation factor RimP [Candidatus Acidoferrum sp.]|nr:ribosome maturation factor RimP [Candidatus Acidoferrum sp.]